MTAPYRQDAAKKRLKWFVLSALSRMQQAFGNSITYSL
jgi:hypothetical protein